MLGAGEKLYAFLYASTLKYLNAAELSIDTSTKQEGNIRILAWCSTTLTARRDVARAPARICESKLSEHNKKA